MYMPATSRTETSPAGIPAVRLNGAAMDSTGSDAYGVPARPAFTDSAWTKLMKSSAAASR
jgi:hypothetical protein